MSQKKPPFAIPILALLFFSLFMMSCGFTSSYKSVKLIVVNDALTDKELNELTQKLTAIFSKKISTAKIHASLDDALNKTRSQYDADNIIEMKTIFDNQQKGEYIIAIAPVDIYAGDHRFLFSTTSIWKKRTVIGLARLRTKSGDIQPSGPDLSQPVIDRLYKLFLRRLAAMAGLYSSCGPMAFSNSLPQLDAVASQYCPSDSDFLRLQGYIQ